MRKPKSKAPPAAAELGNTRALPFRLLKLTNLISRPFFGEIAREFHLTLNEWRTIFVLANHPGISAVEISAHTGLLPMNISRALATLKKSGRVTEAPDPRDMRRALMWLTEDGVQAYKAIAGTAKEHTDALFAGIPAEQLEAFGAVVDVLVERAETMVLSINDRRGAGQVSSGR